MPQDQDHSLGMDYDANAYMDEVIRAVEKGSNYWTLGLRALYVALDMLLWFFGPIPMFGGCLVTVVLLAIHDIKYEELQDYGSSAPSIRETIRRRPSQRQRTSAQASSSTDKLSSRSSVNF